ncbi:hypothetical protein ACWCOP_02180 [Maricaulaceae bacterium MS644]
MNWLLSILAVLVLVEAGIGVCPSAHAAAPFAMTDDEPAMAQSAHAGHSSAPMQSGEPCADHEPTLISQDQACCDGGAACGDCALLSVIFADTSGQLAMERPALVRVFAPVTAPQPPFTFEPPPPRSARA